MEQTAVIKSKANIFVYILFAVLAVGTGMLLWYTTKSVMSGRYLNSVNDIVLLVLTPPIVYFVIIHPFLSWYTFTVTETQIIFSRTLLPFIKISVLLTDLDGYYTMNVKSRESEYLTYIPVSNGMPLPLISSFYIDNSRKIIEATGVKFIGHIPYSMKRYFTITLLKRMR